MPSVLPSSNSRPSLTASSCRLVFVLLVLLSLAVGSVVIYQLSTGERAAFHADQTRAFYLYSLIAPLYDRVINPWHWTPAMRDDSVRDVLLDELVGGGGAALLDAGAGTGFMTEGVVAAAQRLGVDATMTMLDQSPHQLKEAKAKWWLANASKVLGDTHALPFADASFDRYTSAGSVEYWPDPALAVREAYRVLKPGGLAVIVGPARATQSLARQLCDMWYLFPSELEYRSWFAAAGFVDVKVRQILPEWYTPADRRYGLIMGYVVSGRRPAASHQPAADAAAAATTTKRSDDRVRGAVAAVCSSALVDNLLCGPAAFVLGGVGATYYLLLPVYLWMRNALLATAAARLLADALLGGSAAALLWAVVYAALLPFRTATTSPSTQSSWLTAVVQLSRPHTIRGTVLAVSVGYACAVLYTGSGGLLPQYAALLVSALAMNLYIVALNQLTDVAIDVTNKPYLPIAAGALSWDRAAAITGAALCLCLAVATALSPVWLATAAAVLLLGTAYSLPPLRCKNNAVAAMLCIALARGGLGIVGGVATLLDLFTAGDDDAWSRLLHAGTGVDVAAATLHIAGLLFAHAVVIAVFKDVPDVPGDRQAGVRSFAVTLGAAWTARCCALLLCAVQLLMLWRTAAAGSEGPLHPRLAVAVHAALLLWYAVAARPLFAGPATTTSARYTAYYARVVWPAFYVQLVALPLAALARLPQLASAGALLAGVPGLFDAAAALSTAAALLLVIEWLQRPVERRGDFVRRMAAASTAFVSQRALCAPGVIPPLERMPTDCATPPAAAAAAEQLVDAELDAVVDGITASLGIRFDGLRAPALHFFARRGKMMRSRLVLLLARALLECPERGTAADELLARANLLAQVVELEHTASLLHDDVIDGSAERRGTPTVHSAFGNKVAILTGDFLLATAVAKLTQIGVRPVIDAMSASVESLVAGEMLQAHVIANPAMPWSDGDPIDRRRGFGQGGPPPTLLHGALAADDAALLERHWYCYAIRNYHKTASLFANACASVAHIAALPDRLVAACFAFGAHLGLAFQIVDDQLDFVGRVEQLGKPLFQDVSAGLATAPVLFAAERQPALVVPALLRGFAAEGDVRAVTEAVLSSDAIARTTQLAEAHIGSAVAAIMKLPPSPAQSALIDLAVKLLHRTS